MSGSTSFTTITLNPTEQRLADYMARARYAVNREQGAVDRKIGPQSTEQTDLQGIAAEIAFARLMNVYPDTSLDSRPDHDVLVPTPLGSLRVDVKCTRYPQGKLLAVLGKASKRPDAYVLMIGESPDFMFAGVAWADDLLREDRVTDLGHGPTYAMSQGDLMGWMEWLRVVSETAMFRSRVG